MPEAEVYDLDVVAAEVAKEPFRFRFGGQEWSLAHLSDIDWRVVERADTGDMQAVRAAFEYGLGAVQFAEFDKLSQPVSVVGALFEQWLRHAGLREGESSASPTSSASTAGPSKRPSRRTTRASGSGTSSRVN